MTECSVEVEVQSIARETRRVFDTSWSADDQEFARRLLSRHRKQLRRIARHKGKKGGKQRFEIRRTLESYPARFCAAARVLDRQYRKARKNKIKKKDKEAVPKPTFEDVEVLAKRVSPYIDPKEPIHQWSKSKAGGGHRTITAFGPLRTCQQFLVKDVLSVVVADSEPRDYALRGGAKRLINRIVDFENTQPNDDHEYVKADIKSCYDSIAPKGLEAVLPLPTSVTRNVVCCQGTGVHTGEDLSVVDAYSPDDNCSEGGFHKGGSVGLPTGSAASNTVLAYVIQDALASLVERTEGLNYADDILFRVDNSYEHASAIKQELEEMLRNHPTGPLEVKCSLYSPGEGFTFLGYYLSVVPAKYGGKFRARASYDARDAFRSKLVSKVHFEYSSWRRRKVANRYLESWIGSFAAWHRSSQEEEYFRLMVTKLCELLDYYDYNALGGLNFSDPHEFDWCRGELGGEWTGPALGPAWLEEAIKCQ